MAIVVVGNVFVDIKGFPEDLYIPGGHIMDMLSRHGSTDVLR